MDLTSELFDRLDAWRHLPNYQLERRADIFFSLYLSEALERKLGFPVSEVLVPEFPVRIGTIRPDIPIDKSYKIDYLAMSADGSTPIFVELKTEGASRRESQDMYLLKSQSVGLSSLLEGVRTIFGVTNAKRKYYHLLLQLEQLGVIEITPALAEVMVRDDIDGANRAAAQWSPAVRAFAQPLIVYVQPNAPEKFGDTGSAIGQRLESSEDHRTTESARSIITFHEFAETVDKYTDTFSQRFAMSLREWADTIAGRGRRPARTSRRLSPHGR